MRRSALPRPGTAAQLREFVGRIMARRLDRSRPLWEMYLVEGLADNRFALVAKSHLALVDGVDTVDIGQVLLDAVIEPHSIAGAPDADTWHPLPEPTSLELLFGALWESTQDPAQAIENVRGTLTGALGVAVAVGEAVGGVGGALGELAGDALRGRRPLNSPLAGLVSEQRRFATVRVPLADLRAVREEHAHTINDVILAVISGGLRSWLLTRGESISSGSSLTALMPMSVTEDDGELTSLGSQVAPYRQRLPIGEPNALMRLHQVAFATQAHKDTGRAVGARSLSDIAGFAPATLHALGVRVSTEVMRKPYDLIVTNVPGPQVPLYAAGARLAASYPVLPLSSGHLLTVGVTSYEGEVFFGLNADRDAVSDLECWPSACSTSWRNCWTPRFAPPACGSRPVRPRRRHAGRPRRRPPPVRSPPGRRPVRSARPYARWSPGPPVPPAAPGRLRPLRPRRRRPRAAAGQEGARQEARDRGAREEDCREEGDHQGGSGQAAAKKAANKAPAKKAPAKKAPAKRAPAKKAPAKETGEPG